jgi:arabinogalactan oligomer/maltooligosaccharide transport system substrate-binding protein
MKKTVAPLLCAALVITCAAALVSCSKSASSGGNTGSTITVWMDNDGWADAVIAAFTEKYPDITVKYQNIGNVDSRDKVSLDGPAGIGPDVFLMPHDHIGQAVADGLTEPFPADLQRKYAAILLDASIQTCTGEDGRLYAAPISTENIAFFYNKDLLGTAPVPQTFEEVIAFAKTWNNPAQNKWALRWQVAEPYNNYFFLTAFGYSVFGANRDDYKKPGFDQRAVTQGVDFHHSLRQYYNVNVADATYDATVGAFQRGEVPFTITGPWAIDDAKKAGVNFGITKIPTIAGNQPRCFSGNILAAVSSYSKNFEAAFTFVDFLVSEEGMTIQFQATGKLATYEDISGIAGLRDDPYLAGIMEQAPYADPMPVIPEVQNMWNPMADLFTFTWDGDLTTAGAQKKAMDDYDTELMMAGKSRN